MTNTAERLRSVCNSIRAKPTPLSDLIPLMQLAADELDQAQPEQAVLTFDGMSPQTFIGNELFEFQEATGFDTAAEYRAAHLQPERPASKDFMDITNMLNLESMTTLEGHDEIYKHYATTFGRTPDTFMQKVVGETKQRLIMWWGAHRETIRTALVAHESRQVQPAQTFSTATSEPFAYQDPESNLTITATLKSLNKPKHVRYSIPLSLSEFKAIKVKNTLLDSIDVASLWAAFDASDESKRCVEWSVNGEHKGALFVAFRAGVQHAIATPATQLAPVLPPLGPHDHPEPHTMKWTKIEMRFIREYALTAITANKGAA